MAGFRISALSQVRDSRGDDPSRFFTDIVDSQYKIIWGLALTEVVPIPAIIGAI